MNMHVPSFSTSISLAVPMPAALVGYRVKVAFDPMIGGLPKKSMRSIVEETLKLFPRVTYAEVMGPRTLRRIVKARQRCMYEVHRLRPDQSFPQIGRFFSGRTHATIIWAVKTMQAEIEKDPEAIAYVGNRLEKTKDYAATCRAKRLGASA